MKKSPKLDITESSDFQYLLELMMPLYREPQYTWLPELFSIIGYEKLILLCKFCGGESIRIPTLQELSDAVEALQQYYDVFISHSKGPEQIPVKYRKLVNKIKETFDARYN